MKFWPLFQVSITKGPPLIGFVFIAWRSLPLGKIGARLTWISTNAGVASSMVKTTVLGSGALTASPFGKLGATFCGSVINCCHESATSADVSGDPSENLSPSRRWNVNVLKSGEWSQDSAA